MGKRRSPTAPPGVCRPRAIELRVADTLYGQAINGVHQEARQLRLVGRVDYSMFSSTSPKPSGFGKQPTLVSNVINVAQEEARRRQGERAVGLDVIEVTLLPSPGRP